MIILHTSEHEGGNLFFWAESSSVELPSSSSRRGRKPKDSAIRPYLHDAGPERLNRALREAGMELELKASRFQPKTVWLPTWDGCAIPSSGLIAELPELKRQIELKPWRVCGCLLKITETINLLCRALGKETLTPGVVIGADLAWYSQVLRFAGSLISRQQYLPGITAKGDDFFARWEPVYHQSDAEKFKHLASRMPPSARAFSNIESSEPPSTPAMTICKSFISAAVDYLVRSSAGENSVDFSAYKKRRGKTTFKSVHDAWLAALRSKDGIIEWESEELTKLAEQVRQWRQPITLTTHSLFRLCFRLEEPPPTETDTAPAITSSSNGWYVRYLLQPKDDPSLLIPLEQAWKKSGKETSALKRHGAGVHEYLLSSLGQASGVCPRIAGSLKKAQPAGYEMDAAGAYEFLTQTSLTLEQAGFGVMLPTWWSRKGTKTQITVKIKVKSPRMQGGGGLSLAEMVRFDWHAALGEKSLSMSELEALARLKAPLVRVRGQWVSVQSEEIQAAIEFWKKKAAGKVAVRDLIQMALGANQPEQGFTSPADVAATGGIGELLNRLQGRGEFQELPTPTNFSGTLRPYQVRGYSWLAYLRQWGLGACLADDMGLGKTIQTLAMIQRDWHDNGGQPALLVCPMSVVNNWQKEAARFTPELPVLVHHGADRKKGAAFKKTASKQALVVSSYALLQRDIDFLKEVPWSGVVLDEAQNIKNPETKQARAARSLRVDYRLALTGTPVENHVGDLRSIMEFLNPGLLGTQAEFKRNFFIPIQAGQDPEAAGRLRRITGPFILRRLKTDKTIIADLPDKQEMKVFCNLTKEQASLYAAVLKEAEENLDAAEGIGRKGVILATLSKLKQVCNHPAQLLGDNSVIPNRSGKLARLTEMLEEILDVGDKALVFSQFAEMGAILQKHLQETFGREALFLHGGVLKKQRDRLVERFQEKDDGPAIFILSLKAGGTGLNLTRANQVFHFDRWWNPAVENQATDRAFRIGQTKNVQVHKFICAGTLEEKIDQMLESKKTVAENTIGAGEGWLTELSNDHLKEIFALRREAVGE